MPDEDDWFEDADFIAMAKRSEVVSVRDYGSSFFYSDARDRRAVMAAATRIDDRSQEIPLNRGGDYAYRRFPFVGGPVISRPRIPEAPELVLGDDGNLDEEESPKLVLLEPLHADPFPAVVCDLYDLHGNPLPQEKREKARIYRPVEERFFLCPLLDTMQQTPRGPFHMTPNWWLDERLAWYLELQSSNPECEVPYPMVGLRDRLTEKKSRRAIRLGLPNYDPDLPNWKCLPPEIRKLEGDEPQPDDGIRLRAHITYVAKIKDIDLRGLTYLAHFDGYLENLTAEQVYNNLLETVRRVKDPESLWYDAVFADFIVEPPEGDKKIYSKWRKLYDLLVEEHYDRWYPAEQYRWRENLSDILGQFPNTPEGKAAAQEALVDLTIHVITPPRIWTEYVPTHDEVRASHRNDDGEEYKKLRWTGKWEVKVDWTPFRCFAEGIEAWRDWNRMIHHWQTSKNMRHSRDAGDLVEGDIKNARRNDHGGIWQPVQYKYDWRFMKLYNWANQVAPLPERPEEIELQRQTDESVEGWQKRVRENWDTYSEWSSDANTADFQGRNITLVEIRRHILGWAWFWVDPEWEMAHDTVLMSDLNRKKFKWNEMMIKYIRGQNSNAGQGVFPRYQKLVEDVLPYVRNYPDEDDWLDVDEYTLRDPVDGWLHQDGIISFTVMNQDNIRLSGVFSHAPSVRLTYDNCTNARDFIVLMSKNLPTEPILQNARLTYEDAKLAQVIHIWPKVWKLLEGYSEEVIMAMADELDEMHKHSDRRVLLWATFKARGKKGGVRAWEFGEANRVVGEGYGRRLKRDSETRKKIQQRITRLLDLAWRCNQIDRQIWFVRSVLRNPFMKADDGAIMSQCSSAMNGGLHPDYAIDALEQISTAGWLKIANLGDMFSRAVTNQEKKLEAHFDNVIVEPYTGRGKIDIIKKDEMFVALADEEGY